MKRSQKSGPTAGRRADLQLVKEQSQLQARKEHTQQQGKHVHKENDIVMEIGRNPRIGDEVLMSMKVMKVDGIVDENSGLKYTAGDKSQSLLSTSIDEALSNMLKDEEAQLKCSPEYAEGATINLTLVHVAEKHEEKARRRLVSVQGKSIVDLVADSTRQDWTNLMLVF